MERPCGAQRRTPGPRPEVWRAALDASYAERATGRLGALRETFRTLALRCRAEPSDGMLTAACEARLAAQGELFALRDDALAVLGELRARGLRVGVLSDCTVELSTAWDGLPLSAAVDARVLSCEEGRRKPDPELFRTIAAALGAAPGECLYVGDGGGSELTGASGCGMTAYMLRADDWHLNDAHSREDDWPGPYLASLTAVLDLNCVAPRPGSG